MYIIAKYEDGDIYRIGDTYAALKNAQAVMLDDYVKTVREEYDENYTLESDDVMADYRVSDDKMHAFVLDASYYHTDIVWRILEASY